MDEDAAPDQVLITKKNGEIVSFSAVLDYVYRPTIFSDVTLFDWIRLYEKEKSKPANLEGQNAGNVNTERIDDIGSDDELDVISNIDSNNEVKGSIKNQFSNTKTVTCVMNNVERAQLDDDDIDSASLSHGADSDELNIGENEKNLWQGGLLATFDERTSSIQYTYGEVVKAREGKNT